MRYQIRTESELKLVRRSGRITALALKKVLEAAKPGVNLLHLEKIATAEILSQGAKLSFTTVGEYKWATCLTVNDELVHGIPRDYQLKDGDVFSVDVGALYKGWHTDAAWSIRIGEGINTFLQVGEEALWKGIKQAKVGNKVGDISEAIQEIVEKKAGYSVSRELVGHGVGRELHEDPMIPGFGYKNTGPILQKNMTIAIEVIYAEDDAHVGLADDGWTYVTLDHSLGGLFEMSVVISENGAEVLTDWRKV